MIAWFARNKVAANVLLLVIVSCGFYAVTTSIPLEVFPDTELDLVTISITQRAATPEDMESGITRLVEEAVADLPYIDELKSRSSEQSSVVSVFLDTGTDTQKALNEVKSRVDALSNLPDTAERPVIKVPLVTQSVLSLVIYGDLDEHEIAAIARKVREDIVRIPGISQAEIEGIRPYQISIEISPELLRAHQLSLQDVANAIDQQAIDLSAGQLRSAQGDILLRSKNQAYDFEDYFNIVLKRFADGSVISLGQIATITDGFNENPIVTQFNGHKAAMINIQRVGKESAIAIADTVRDYIATEKNRYPETVQFEIWDDNSRSVRERLNTLLNSAWQGAILIAILLTLFLHPTVALWVVVGIPVCFAGALALFPLMGLSLNLISMFSFILVLGVVVDDAIVTGENIYSHRVRGSKGITAAIEGTHEVALPVFFGIATTMLAFIPMLMLEGASSTFGDNIGFAVIATLAFSLVESKLILPSHLSRLNINRQSKNRAMQQLEKAQNVVSVSLERFLNNIYQPLLRNSLKRRYITLLAFICTLLIVMSLSAFGWVRFAFFPIVDSEKAIAVVRFPAGTPLLTTHNAINKLENAANDMRQKYRQADGSDGLINNIVSTLGAVGGGNGLGASNLGRVQFEVNQALIKDSGLSIHDLTKEWRERVGVIVGVEQLTYQANLFHGGSPISVQLYGENRRQMQLAIDEISDFLAQYDGVFDIENSLQDGKRELMIKLKPQAEMLGLNLQSVTRQVRNAFFGVQAQRIQRGQDDIRVMVLYPADERENLAHLENLLIITADGNETRFADIATVEWSRSPSSILRSDQLRTAEVKADLDPSKVIQGLLVEEVDAFASKVLERYPGIRHSMEGQASEQKEASHALTLGLIGLLMGIYALLAVAFKSYWQPLIVMSVIPFALIGAIVGHLITGISLSIFSIFGILALVGVVVNDSLVLVDWINRRLAEGQPLHEVVSQAGRARFRAVLLTSLTTFVGLLPILFQTSTGAQFLIPMATSLGFGILFATAITLILVPCNYLILEDFSNLKRRIAGHIINPEAANR